MATVTIDRAREEAERLGVAVCVPEPSLRERVCAALVAGGHGVSARTAAIEELPAPDAEPAPSSVVIAANRPDRSALTALGEVVRRFDRSRVVLVCERAGGTEVRRALELGVGGIVLAADLEGALAPVVSASCGGQVSVPEAHRSEVSARVLTNREKQILGLVVMGMTNAQIAAKLYLAESTVKSHLSSGFAKLGVASRNEAVQLILDPHRGVGLGILSISGGGRSSRS